MFYAHTLIVRNMRKVIEVVQNVDMLYLLLNRIVNLATNNLN